MDADPRYVFDPNVLVSAMLFNASVPGRAFCRSLDQGAILISQALIEELSEVLSRHKFNRYLTRKERDEFLKSAYRPVRACGDYATGTSLSRSQ